MDTSSIVDDDLLKILLNELDLFLEERRAENVADDDKVLLQQAPQMQTYLWRRPIG